MFFCGGYGIELVEEMCNVNKMYEKKMENKMKNDSEQFARRKLTRERDPKKNI